MKALISLCTLTMLLFFVGCSSSSDQISFCVSAGNVFIAKSPGDEKTFVLTMEDLENPVIFLSKSPKNQHRFGRINMSTFLNILEKTNAFNDVALPVTFCCVTPKSGTIHQFATTAFSPEYDRSRATISWTIEPKSAESIPLGSFAQNVLVLTLNSREATYLFRDAYSP